MTSRPLRFGLSLGDSVPRLKEQARRAEQIGFDVAVLPDHLGMAAPLPSLLSIAYGAALLTTAVIGVVAIAVLLVRESGKPA